MAEETKEKKNKKISRMTIPEIDSALKKATDNGNIGTSKYVQHLEQRKAILQTK